PLFPLAIALCSVPAIGWQWEHQTRTANSLYIRTPQARRLRYYREVVLAPEPAKDVRLYGLPAFFLDRYGLDFAGAVRALRAGQFLITVRAAGGALGTGLAAGAVYVFAVWQALRGSLSVGDVALYGGAALLLQSRLETVGWLTGVLPRELDFLPALDRVLNAPPDLPLPVRPRPVPAPMREGIAFEDVWFAYPGPGASPSGRSGDGDSRAAPVLRGVSFALPVGQSLALVGHNGAGKTTIVKLLLRLYDPDRGRITLDGADLRDYDPAEVRRRMGVVFQDFVRYDLPVRENVGLGALEALGDDARLLEAARRAGAAELVDGLPRGLDTPLGARFGGRALSGGEWQKLALARAFVRDCDVLVLDEPTAALDVRTEHEVYARFGELTRGRTTLLISHRFSTVRMAGRILYLEDGRVAEAGSHDALLRGDGEYARLYRLQASRYVDEQERPPGTVAGTVVQGHVRD
ncbi:MAG TPA: ABC transporter ATP-binding protein, partial [Longimicrobiales bacterium]|nr:ABC transporter ATP-binding protein [Longimicrobiales bacterium]